MTPSRQQHPFPIQALPRTMLNAVLDVHHQIQSPISMVATLAIAVASEAVQGNALIQLPDGQLNLLSNWTLVIAESGSGKTPTMQRLREPIASLEIERQKQYEKELKQFKADYEAWKGIKDVLLTSLQKEARADADTTASQARLTAHILNEPSHPRLVKLTYSDATPQAFFNGLFENWPHAAITSDEAVTFFNSAMSNNLAQLNQRWEPGPLSIERRSNKKQIYVEDPRVMLNLAVQPAPFERYFNRSGNEARDLGFFARLLFCYPDSNVTSHDLEMLDPLRNGLQDFHARVDQLLRQTIKNTCSPDNKGLIITFSKEALHHVNREGMSIREYCEEGNALWYVKDYGSKLFRHYCRIAGVLEYFETGSTEISLNTAERATAISDWYANEYIRLFKKKDEIDRRQSDSLRIMGWIRKKTSRYIKKNDLRKNGPIRDNIRINNALDKLIQSGEICVAHYFNHMVVDIQPHKPTNYFQLESDIFGSGRYCMK